MVNILGCIGYHGFRQRSHGPVFFLVFFLQLDIEESLQHCIQTTLLKTQESRGQFRIEQIVNNDVEISEKGANIIVGSMENFFDSTVLEKWFKR